MVKNPPANAGDTGSSPGPGRSYMLRSNQAHAPQLLSLCSRACEPQLLSPCAKTTEAHAPRAHALQQEKPLQWEARAPQWRVGPTCRNERKPARSDEDPTQPKIKNINKNKFIKKKFPIRKFSKSLSQFKHKHFYTSGEKYITLIIPTKYFHYLKFCYANKTGATPNRNNTIGRISPQQIISY